jgi:hypothetical protein
VRRKVAARRATISPVAHAALTLEEEIRRRAAPVLEAWERALLHMAEEPGFTSLVTADREMRLSSMLPGSSLANFVLSGRCADCAVQIHFREKHSPPEQTQLTFSLFVNDYRIRKALNCGDEYAEQIRVRGTMADPEAFVADAEDLIAEFLADVVASSLGPEYCPGLC